MTKLINYTTFFSTQKTFLHIHQKQTKEPFYNKKCIHKQPPKTISENYVT